MKSHRLRADRRSTLLGAVIVMALAAGIPTGGAATPQQIGYWWKLQTASGPRLPPPQNVPSGGLWVANDVNGPQAISAVLYQASSQEAITGLVLQVAPNGSSGSPGLLACPVTGPWTQDEAGPWAAQPKYDCRISAVTGQLSPDGTSWSFEIGGIARSGVLNVAIIPGSQSVFSVAFNPPGPDSVVTTRVTPSPSPTPSPRPTTPRTPTPSPKASVLANKTAGDVGLPTPTPEPASSASAPPSEPVPSPSTEVVALPVPPQDFRRGSSGHRWLWGIAAIPVLALVLWMIRVGRYPIVPPEPPQTA